MVFLDVFVESIVDIYFKSMIFITDTHGKSRPVKWII